MFDGSSIVGYKQIEDSDMKAVPELSSYTILTNDLTEPEISVNCSCKNSTSSFFNFSIKDSSSCI